MKLLALDTSHFGQWVKDANSRRAEERRRALAFQEFLDSVGWILAVSHHHLAEIHTHADPEVRAARLGHLRSCPLLAYVRTGDGPEAGFGSVVDVLAAEIKAALATGSNDPGTVASVARPMIFAYDTGAAVMRQLDAMEPLFGDLIRAQAAKTRWVVAVSRAGVEKPPEVTLAELLRYPLRAPEDQRAFFERYGASLLREVADRGDERIADPKAVTDRFMTSVVEGVRQCQETGDHPVLWLLQRMGLGPADIETTTTIGDLIRISFHRHQALIAARAAGINPSDVVRRVRTDLLPSAIISSALERYGQEPKRRKGSVANDTFMACLSPYVHMTTVDKGTFGNVERASARSPAFKAVIGAVARRPIYSDLMLDLSAV